MLKFLTRRGLRFTVGKCHWTQAHHAWLDSLVRTGLLRDEDAIVFAEFLELMRYARHRRDSESPRSPPSARRRHPHRSL